MVAIILKELRAYCRTPKYRRIQFLTLGALSLLLFVATTEFYSGSRTGNPVDVGKQTYAFFIIALFGTLFLLPRHAVEAWATDSSHRINRDLLALTPIPPWKRLAGKLISVVIWATWGIWLTVPLFALSGYIGGTSVSTWMKCGLVLGVSCLFFALIGTGAALWTEPIRAKAISYAAVLLITFLPLLPSPALKAFPLFAAISPLAALLSILYPGAAAVWMWNIGLFCLLTLLSFPILARASS